MTANQEYRRLPKRVRAVVDHEADQGCIRPDALFLRSPSGRARKHACIFEVRRKVVLRLHNQLRLRNSHIAELLHVDRSVVSLHLKDAAASGQPVLGITARDWRLGRLPESLLPV